MYATIDALKKKGYERTKSSVLSRAHLKMIYVGDIKGYVAGYTLFQNPRALYKMLFYACLEGVLKVLPSGKVRYLVPKAWGDDYMARHAERKERDM